MAWRDSQGSRKRLLLFLSSMVIGVAALVAINSFGDSLERTIDEEAKTLLGADMSLESDEPFAPETEALIDSLGGEQVRHVSFSSMVLFPKSRDTRLATVRAQEPGYPFYGEVGTDPPEAAEAYHQGRRALVDGALLRTFDAVPGDSLQIGGLRYEISGALVKTPRESAVSMLVSPPIYIPLAHLDTSLVGAGSRVEYEVYFKFAPERGIDPEALREELEAHRQDFDVGMDTVQEEREQWGEALINLNRFLGLVGFVALILGGLGVGGAVHVHIRQRLDTVALLRCLGAPSQRTLWIFLAQALVMGALAGLAGCILGVATQAVVPRVVADFLPFDIAFELSPSGLALGLGMGLGATLIFALLPLVGVRRISPLRALRSAVEPQAPDRSRYALYAIIAVGLAAFAVLQAGDIMVGLGYSAGLALVFGLLFLVAKLLMKLARRFAPTSWSYPWRQGLANMHRPNNQTILMMLALGLGTFLIMTMVLVESTLVTRISTAHGEDRPDMVLFDIQPHQLRGLTQLIEEQQLSVIDQSPIVTMRIHSIGGARMDSLRADSTARITWAHTREYMSTYRNYLTDAERVVAGAFEGEHSGGAGLVSLSIEQGLAEDELHVEVGDTIVFDVQGALVRSRVGSIRKVDFQQMRSNFFMVFPTGVLEEAPQTHVVMTRTENDEALAQLQTAAVEAYPNVSAISLSLVLRVFDELFSRISLVIRFMALFSVLAGILVLIGAIMISRMQRIEETVLLKTLGASRRQVFSIMLIEYLFLGVLASATGLVLAYAGSWCLAAFVFDVPFTAAPIPLAAAVFVVTGLTVTIGLLNSRGIYARPPLEVLRAEG